MGISRKLAPLWVQESGAELKQLYDGGESLGILLPRQPAVYIWKLTLTPDVLQKADPNEYTDWLNRLCSAPLGIVRDTQLSHYLHLSNIELRGRGLPDSKRRFFRSFLSNLTARRWMTQYLAELSTHLPALYVGEADNLQQRVRQHIAGESQFGAQIAAMGELNWQMMSLFYVKVDNGDSNAAAAARRSLEYLTTSLTIAGYTSRPG